MHLLVSYCILRISRVPYLNTNWSMSGWSSISKEKKKTVTKTQCSILSTHAIPYDLLSQSKYVILMGSFIYTHLPNIYMVRISVSVWFVMIMTSHNAHSYALFYIIGWSDSVMCVRLNSLLVFFSGCFILCLPLFVIEW